MKKVSLLFAGIISCNLMFAQNIFPSSGRAGIYTTNPAASLQVKGGARIGTLANYTAIDSATGNLSFKGTAKYYVANNAYAFGSPFSQAGLYFYVTASNYRLDVRDTAGFPVFNVSVKPGGNVGIGTATPANKLSVAGNVDFSGNLTTGGYGSFSSVTSTADGNFNSIRVGRGGGGIIDNTVLGYSALTFNTSGTRNVALGNKCLQANVTGSSNIGIGWSAATSNTTGTGNIALGDDALYNNKTGGSNVSIGVATMISNGLNAADNDNVAIGAYAMQNSSSSFNTAVGSTALLTLFNNGNATGAANTALGYNTQVSFGTITNATVIGANATVDASNKVRVGNASVSSIGGQVGWTNFSDGRIKQNIKANVPGLAFINLLKPVTYNFNLAKEAELLGEKNTKDLPGKNDIEKILFTGFVAQDVQAAAKKINYDFSGIDNSGKVMGLRYSEFVVPLVKAVQELSTENEDLKTTVASQQQQINTIMDKLSQLQNALVTGNGQNTTSQAVTLAGTNIASLLQNAPNPFSSNTVIRYYIPASVNAAQIIITDNKGTAIKTVNLTQKGNGQVTLTAGSLASGTYFYSLIADGKKIDTKQMQIVK